MGRTPPRQSGPKMCTLPLGLILAYVRPSQGVCGFYKPWWGKFADVPSLVAELWDVWPRLRPAMAAGRQGSGAMN